MSKVYTITQDQAIFEGKGAGTQADPIVFDGMHNWKVWDYNTQWDCYECSFKGEELNKTNLVEAIDLNGFYIQWGQTIINTGNDDVVNSLGACLTNLTEIKNGVMVGTNGRGWFNNTKLNSTNVDFSSIISADTMFSKTHFVHFANPLPNVETATGCFSHCPYLESFDITMPKLRKAIAMFDTCKSLHTFNKNAFPLVEDGSHMFMECWGLTEVEIEMPQLTAMTEMFQGCINLTRFVGKFDSATALWGIFESCNNLTYVNITAPLINSYPKYNLFVKNRDDCTFILNGVEQY